MFPTLIDLGWFNLPSYFTLLMSGYIVALLIFVREHRRQGVDYDDALDLGLWVLVWGVIGARLLHVFVDGFFWDYVHLCTDPMLVEGRDLIGRPASELMSSVQASGMELSSNAKTCTESAQCLAAQETGYDVGAICNTESGFCHPEQDCFRWAKFWAGGLAFYGGFIGATIFSLYFATRHRMGMLWAPKMADLKRTGGLKDIPGVGALAHFFKYLRKFPRGILMVADTAAAPIALAHALGRMGCFLSGCCFGKITDGSTGVNFPAGSQAYQLHRKENIDLLREQFKEVGEWVSLPVHPTQLYEVVVNLTIFAILFFVVRTRKRFHGQVFGAMLILYGMGRFGLEFFRADMRGEFFGLATSQLIAIPLILIGLAILILGGKNAGGVIDDGANPPMGKPRHETVQQPVVVEWEGEQVSPVSDWPAPLEATLEKNARKKGPELPGPSKPPLPKPPSDSDDEEES